MEVHNLARTGGRLVASFPVEESDNLLLVSDQGQIIRVPVKGISRSSRKTKGVIIFRTAPDEHVVSVESIEGGQDVDDETPDEGDAGEA
jgi:DNA gyrase subunit A